MLEVVVSVAQPLVFAIAEVLGLVGEEQELIGGVTTGNAGRSTASSASI